MLSDVQTVGQKWRCGSRVGGGRLLKTAQEVALASSSVDQPLQRFYSGHYKYTLFFNVGSFLAK